MNNYHKVILTALFLIVISLSFPASLKAAQIIPGFITIEEVDPLGSETTDTNISPLDGGLVNFWYSYPDAAGRSSLEVAFNYRTVRIFADGSSENISTKMQVHTYSNPTVANLQHVKAETYVDPLCTKAPHVVACGFVITIWEKDNPMVVPTTAWGNYQPYTTLGSVMINVPSITTASGASPVNLSALAYDMSTPPQSLLSGVTYEWGLSSTGSIGTIDPMNTDTVSFIPLNPGSGDLFVTARYNNTSITKSIQVVVTDPNGLKPGDADGDGDIDIFDYSIVLSNFGKTVSGRDKGDLDEDGDVDIFDYNAVLSSFGQ